MKNKNGIIVLIVVLVIIIFVLISFLYNYLTGKFEIKKFGSVFQGETVNCIIEESYDIEEIEKLKIKANLGDIKLKISEDSAIKCEVYGKDSEDVKVKLDNKELNITYTQNGFNLFGNNSFKREIIVFIPEEYAGDINIDSDCGDVESDNLKNVSLDIKQDCGDIEIGDIKNVSVDSSLGDVKIKSINNKCKIDADCGDVKIDSVQIKEYSSIKNDLGNVKIESINDIYIDADTDLGEVEIESNNRKSEVTLKIECDCGDIKVD